MTAAPGPSTETVVMKFGGSSVADPDKIRHVAQRLGEARERGVRVVPTGSAMGDATAVALAAALGASCEIYSDVDGVFTADPRIVPEARKLDRISYEEMLEMAASGAKVLMLRAVEIARNQNVPIHARSTFSNEAGTWIAHPEGLEQPIVSAVTHPEGEIGFSL